MTDDERLLVAAATAHRACCGSEHDPSVGKLHGCCVVCGVQWPCETASIFIDAARSQRTGAQGRESEREKERDVVGDALDVAYDAAMAYGEAGYVGYALCKLIRERRHRARAAGKGEG